jgi:hypothetical protein
MSPHWLPMFQVPMPMADTFQPNLPNPLYSIELSLLTSFVAES